MARKRNAAESAPMPEASTLEPQEVSMALAPQPAPMGMVRISKGQQQRCIWPVHLAGWQQLGWRAVTPSAAAGAQPAEPQLMAAAADEEPADEQPLGTGLDEPEADGWLSDLGDLS